MNRIEGGGGMTDLAFKEAWLEEEQQAEIRGWDFSHIWGKYEGYLNYYDMIRSVPLY